MVLGLLNGGVSDSVTADDAVGVGADGVDCCCAEILEDGAEIVEGGEGGEEIVEDRETANARVDV